MITITQDITGIYPAFNNSYIKYESDLTNVTRSEITTTIYGHSLTFVIYPDSFGRFVFNLRDIAKNRATEGNFKDPFILSSWNYNYFLFFFTQQITIKVFNDSTNDTLVKEYSFNRSVKQVGERQNNNQYQILTYNNNEVDYYINYWEGFPLIVNILKTQLNDKIKFKSLSNNLETNEFNATIDNSTMGIVIDKGNGENWTSENILPLFDNLNRLEMYVNDTFKLNLNLIKKKKCAGIYLKWLNENGGFSSWLFSEYYRDEIKTKSLDVLRDNSFNNVDQNLTGGIIIGKSATQFNRLKTTCNPIESKILNSLFTSPYVQIYSSKEANAQGEWLDVRVNGGYKNSNKRGSNEYIVTIEYPDLNTQTL